MLLWQTRERLKTENDLGPFTLPEPAEDYPVFYVLDGQQRITSIFGVFQTVLEPNRQEGWLDVYFDLEADPSPQENQFAALTTEEADPERYFPLRALFNTSLYGRLTRALNDDSVAERIDKMRERFQTVQIPAQITKTEDKATVAIIFERVNRQGVELNTFQLLTAWTWSEDFQLQSEFNELSADIASFGFDEIGTDTNLLLRCCSAILTGDSSPQALMNLNGGQVRDRFDEITNGIKYAIDYVKAHFHVAKLTNMPFATQLVPLSVFFAIPGNRERNYSAEQAKKINNWFWKSSFSRRYSSGVIRNLNADIAEMVKLRDGSSSNLGGFDISIGNSFFINNTFGITSVNTKTFILMLAQIGPLSFLSGAPVDLEEKLKEANRTEFHHLMPRKFLRETEQTTVSDSALANFSFMSRADNRLIGGARPSEYRSLMNGDVAETLRRSLIPESLFADEYSKFMIDRSLTLLEVAAGLCDLPNPGLEYIASDFVSVEIGEVGAGAIEPKGEAGTPDSAAAPDLR